MSVTSEHVPGAAPARTASGVAPLAHKAKAGMLILLIAHDFPPIPSPQSLRWAYLVRELDRLGHRVHVLAPDHPGYGPAGGLPKWHDTVRVHRTFPGPFAWSLGRGLSLRNRLRRRRAGPKFGSDSHSSVVPVEPARLNWKGRLMEGLRMLYASALFPDVRSEWNPWARRTLKLLLGAISPDVVVVSHEPASTLPLGLLARRMGYPLLADLGDPVYADYTPKRWRRRAWRLEREICRKADFLTVTTEMTKALLCQRHGIEPGRVEVMEQGFEGGMSVPARAGVFDASRLELLYTGSFYAFRVPKTLIEAVIRTPGVRLSVASSSVPAVLTDAAQNHPQAFRLLGALPHQDVLRLQMGADLLVNLANRNVCQIPGKIYEYLGARRPILHVGGEPGDEAAKLMERTGAGWTCGDDAAGLAGFLAELVHEHKKGGVGRSLARNEDIIDKYTWETRALLLSRLLRNIAHASSQTTGLPNV